MRGARTDERLPKLIRLQREEMGWSQEFAARQVRMSKSRWRQIEQGNPAPPDTIARMLDVLEIRPEAAERLGANRAAKALRLRRELLGAGRLPAWVAGEEEAYLWDAPRMTEPERRHLIITLRVMRADRGDIGTGSARLAAGIGCQGDRQPPCPPDGAVREPG